jgi:hypothetical protein
MTYLSEKRLQNEIEKYNKIVNEYRECIKIKDCKIKELEFQIIYIRNQARVAFTILVGFFSMCLGVYLF